MTEHYKRGSELQQEEIENQLLYQKSLKKFPDINSKTYPLVVLSSYHLPKTTPLSTIRKDIYLQHIWQLIEAVVEDIQSGKNVIPIDNAQYPPSNRGSLDEEKMDALNEMICIECKGRCCLNGGDNAYLDTKTIKRYMMQQPDLSPEQVLQKYKAGIVKKTHLTSCINHTEKGCSLPKNMRSDQCNNFYCSTIKELNTSFCNLEMIPEGAIVISRPYSCLETRDK